MARAQDVAAVCNTRKIAYANLSLMIRLRLAYIRYLAKHYRNALLNPYISKTPCSSGVSKWSMEFLRFGFIFWKPGIKHKKCGRRIMVSWRQNLNKRVSWNDFCGFLDCYGFKVSPTGKIIRGAKVNQQSATSA